ncbi:MAG: efflux transporter outer membrane subunit [Acidobacteria bacterium]|nr:efflux transporter outer membrane subunit [Acidobacteriota bacterium]
MPQETSPARAFPFWPVLLATLGLLGCSTGVAPPRQPLDLELPAEWSAAPVPDDAAPADAADAWWDSFGDPKLSALVDEALTNNHDLEAAAQRLRQAEARARISGADLAPQLSAGFDGSRARRNFIGLPIPGSAGSVLSTTSTSLGVSLNVSWEADLWGRLRSRRQAAEAELEAARWDLEAAHLSLAGQVAKAWFALVEAREQVRLAEETSENRRLTRRQVQRRYELGLRGPVDLRLAASNEAAAEATLAARRRQLDATQRQLEILLGRYPVAGLHSEGLLPSPPRPVEAGLPADLVTRRPDLRAAERRLSAAGARVAEARAALYPALRLTGSAGRISEELEDLLSGDFSVWSLASGLLQPIFQGGRLKAGVELSAAAADEALARYVQASLAAFAEVETTLAAEGFLRLQEESLERAVEHAAAAQETAQRRYGSGLAEVLEVLESQRQAFQLQSQLLDVRRQRLAARIDLHLALGGGVPPKTGEAQETVPSSR